MNEEKNNMYRLLDEEHEKIKKERQIINAEWNELDQKKVQINDQYTKWKEEEENLRSELNYDFEKQENLRQNYEQEVCLFLKTGLSLLYIEDLFFSFSFINKKILIEFV